MSYVKKIIPYCVWPANWGLTGARKEQAKAEYNLEGKDLKYKLAEIDFEFFGDEKKFDKRYIELDLEYGKIDEYQAEVANLALEHGFSYKKGGIINSILSLGSKFDYDRIDIDLKHGKITEREYDELLTTLEIDDVDSIEYKIRQIEIKEKYGDITKTESEKEIATLKNEPWVTILDADFLNKPSVGSGMMIELDWNKPFVDHLIDNGFVGTNEEEIVNDWFTALGAEVFNEQLAEHEQTSPMAKKEAIGMRTSITKLGDGKAEIS